ncbi:CD99 antigen-like protein 2 isoform X2 [Phycodurus eques]|uniref:CD99 antigen-like protein 2 isoform X2 n=1 Tax=Phycodurus eques TaxID=693459 RepID=UPI002ACED22D|nr:CD99 antigen-like protein 2 isoform X2 [Phycodurus eques]
MARGGSPSLLLPPTTTTTTTMLLLMLLMLAVQVRPQGLDLADALDPADAQTTPAPLPGTGAPNRAKGKPAAGELDLADALDPDNDIDRNEGPRPGGGFSDSDLIDVSKDDSYKPDKGKGGRPSGDRDRVDQRGDNSETTAEVGTIAGIVSAVGVALAGAVSSYISYQKKKLCFGIRRKISRRAVCQAGTHSLRLRFPLRESERGDGEGRQSGCCADNRTASPTDASGAGHRRQCCVTTQRKRVNVMLGFQTLNDARSSQSTVRVSFLEYFVVCY